jgi:hypothetical protein
MLIAFGAASGNWLITPHPAASTLRTIGVVAQVALGIGIGAWRLRGSAVFRNGKQRQSTRSSTRCCKRTSH